MALIVVLFVKAKNWKQPTCTSKEEWVSKSQYNHSMQYSLTIKRSKLLIRANGCA